jgi:hypothetical protein
MGGLTCLAQRRFRAIAAISEHYRIKSKRSADLWHSVKSKERAFRNSDKNLPYTMKPFCFGQYGSIQNKNNYFATICILKFKFKNLKYFALSGSPRYKNWPLDGASGKFSILIF